MALSLQQLSDRVEIDDLLQRYTEAIDAKDWDLLGSVFTPDATLDYTSSGGPVGPFPEVRDWLARALALFPMTHHLIGKSTVKLDGDRADVRSIFYNPMGMSIDDQGRFVADGSGPGRHVFVVGGFYDDTCVRTADGWRISRKVEDQSYMTGGFPEGFTVPE